MTAPDPRLEVIEERLDAARHHGAPAFMIPTIDVQYLLAELRARDEALDGLMRELVAREERWRLAYVVGDLTHEEASQIALEDRWAYAQLADIRGRAAVAAATGGGDRG